MSRRSGGSTAALPGGPPRLEILLPPVARLIRQDVATVVYAQFEWDEAKAEANERKHGVTFEEATTAIVDPRALEAPDFDHADRFVTIGMSAFLRVLFVVQIEVARSGRIRVISARKASPAQRRLYEEG